MPCTLVSWSLALAFRAQGLCSQSSSLWGPGLLPPLSSIPSRAHLQPQHPPDSSEDYHEFLPELWTELPAHWWVLLLVMQSCLLTRRESGMEKGAECLREGHSLLRRAKLSKTRVLPARPQRGKEWGEREKKSWEDQLCLSDGHELGWGWWYRRERGKL